MENGREVPEGGEAKEAQSEAFASRGVPNGKKKTASAAWQSNSHHGGKKG